MPLSPAVLLAFRQGQTLAFNELMREYGGLVRSVCARHFYGLFDQEEAIQEVWLHIFTQRLHLDADRLDSTAGWIKTLARRRCIDLLRRSRPAKSHELAEIESEPGGVDGGPDPEALAAQTETRLALKIFVDKLNKQQQNFVELYFVTGLDYKQIADRLGVTKLRCRYLKKVILGRARRNPALLRALDRWPPAEVHGAH